MVFTDFCKCAGKCFCSVGVLIAFCRSPLHISNFDADIKMSKQARGIRDFLDLKLLTFQSCRYRITLTYQPLLEGKKHLHQTQIQYSSPNWRGDQSTRMALIMDEK